MDFKNGAYTYNEISFSLKRGGQFFASVVDGAFSYLQKDGWRSVIILTFNFQMNYDFRG